MVTLLFGKTLVFWSGTLAFISFLLMLSTCHFIGKFFGFANREKIHKYFIISTIILVVIHVTLALLSSLFGVWL